MRDGLRSTRAAIKIGVGILGYLYLWSDAFLRLASPYFLGGNGLWFAIGWTLLKAAAIWCIVTGIVRLLILTLSGFGSGAQRRVAGHIRDQQVMFRPVTRPPWWRPW